jgi:hypothetical protein
LISERVKNGGIVFGRHQLSQLKNKKRDSFGSPPDSSIIRSLRARSSSRSAYQGRGYIIDHNDNYISPGRQPFWSLQLLPSPIKFFEKQPRETFERDIHLLTQSREHFGSTRHVSCNFPTGISTQKKKRTFVS